MLELELGGPDRGVCGENREGERCERTGGSPNLSEYLSFCCWQQRHSFQAPRDIPGTKAAAAYSEPHTYALTSPHYQTHPPDSHESADHNHTHPTTNLNSTYTSTSRPNSHKYASHMGARRPADPTFRLWCLSADSHRNQSECE